MSSARGFRGTHGISVALRLWDAHEVQPPADGMMPILSANEDIPR
jgi:hypothetical protein